MRKVRVAKDGKRFISIYCSQCHETQKYWEQEDGTFMCDRCGHVVYPAE